MSTPGAAAQRGGAAAAAPRPHPPAAGNPAAGNPAAGNPAAGNPTLPRFDPDDPAGLAAPEALYGPLREQSAVARSEAYGGFYAVLRHAELQQVMSDPATWSAAQGVIIPRNPASGRRPPLHYDPPEHTSYRRLINPVFRPDRLRRMHAVVDAAASELVAALRARGGAPGVGGARYEDICGARGEDAGGARYEDAGGATAATSCDLYRSFCSPYTSRVVCELLNVPASLHAGLAEDMESFESAQRARDRAAIEHYNLVLYETARQVVALRLASPLDPSEDLVSALLAAPPDSSAPTDPETVAGSLRQILVAGHGAPALVIASAVAHLAMDSSLQQRWREDRSLLAAGAEEMLRLHTPNVGFARTASRDTVLAGCPIEAGAAMAVVLPAANHDPRAFGRPEEVSPGRGRDEAHLAFGYGPHRCPGSVVGREELVAALGALLAATSQIDLDGEIGWSPWPTAGPVRLPLRLAWAPPLPAAPPAPADPPAPAAPAPPAPAGHHPERRPV